MFELLVAFILYQFEAGAGWWTVFAVLLLMDFINAFHTGYTEEK
jgi:hypothetical protein